MTAGLLSLSLSVSGCSTLTQSGLAKRRDYLEPMELHAQGRPLDALRELPDKEPGGFITTMERGLLGVYSGHADLRTMDTMTQLGGDLEARKTLSLSREAVAYFYKETEEGYYPAEHEAIAFHLVAGMAFVQAGKTAEAKIEARRAARYLQSDFGAAPGFDDPALRIWLATLWAATGEWESARVDLRKVVQLDPKADWARQLAKRAKPPRQLTLVLSGPGPDVKWEPGATELRRVRFLPGSTPVPWSAEGYAIHTSYPTLPWYHRHSERDHVIRDVMSSSRYMVESAPTAVAAGVVATGGAIAGTTLVITGIVTGVAIALGGVYIVVASGLSGDAAGYVIASGIVLGGMVGSSIVDAGVSVTEKSLDSSAELIDAGMNPVDSYRYVRFLPDHIALASSDRDTPMQLRAGKNATVLPVLTTEAGGSRVQILYLSRGPSTGSKDAPGVVSLAESRRWTDSAHHKTWLLHSVAVPFAEAAAVCENAGNWRLPAWSEWLDAKKAGIADGRRNEVFGQRLRGITEVWAVTAAFNRQRGECRVLDLRTDQEGPTRDCDTPRRVLCVRG